MSHLLSGGEPVHLGGGGVRNFAGKLLGWSEINNPWNRGGGGGGGAGTGSYTCTFLGIWGRQNSVFIKNVSASRGLPHTPHFLYIHFQFLFFQT